MKIWLRRVVLTASVASGVAPLAVAPLSGTAYANASGGQTDSYVQPPLTGMLEDAGLARQALDLASLTPVQRIQIQKLSVHRRTAAAPVRQANRALLTELADQVARVDQASIDEAKLAPAVGAVDHAVGATMPVQVDSLNRLHEILTPEQRGMLIDQVEAHLDQHKAAARAAWGPEADWGTADTPPDHALTRLDLSSDQKSQVLTRLRATRETQASGSLADQTKAFLDAFRSERFDARTFDHALRAGENEETFAALIVPVLTPVQRTTLAEILRERARG
jgi:Spy/CpxP family protein refolding chaperone